MFTRAEIRIFILIAACLVLGLSSRGYLSSKIEYFKTHKLPEKQPNMVDSTKLEHIQIEEEKLSGNLPHPRENHISEKEKGRDKAVFPLDLNTATEAKLMQIKGIGPVLAKAIVEYRKSNGPFENVNQLIHIKGIGEKKLKKFAPFLVIAR
jgi:competence ComEA-like helix-hairpin-helix protein